MVGPRAASRLTTPLAKISCSGGCSMTDNSISTPAAPSDPSPSTRLIVIGGFLGAGKTSLLLAWCRLLLAQGRRVAVLENEAGRVGLDDEFLRQEGLSVRHVLGGCACCDGLGRALEQLQAFLSADPGQVVLLEPTGLAALDQLLASLPRTDPPLTVQAVALADATRFATLVKGLPRLVAAQVAPAQVVVLSKPDLVSESQLAEARAPVAGINPRAEIREADLLHAALATASHLEDLLAQAVAPLSDGPGAPNAGQALSLELDLPAGGLAFNQAEALVRLLVAELLGQGDWGHVKLLGRDARGETRMVSATGPRDLSWRGMPADLAGRASLAVVLAGPGADQIQARLAGLVPRLRPDLGQALAQALPPLPGLELAP